MREFEAQGYAPEGFTLYTYAAVQVFAEAAHEGGLDPARAVEQALHGGTYDTVLGPLTFDDKGDVTGAAYVMYKWDDGKYAEISGWSGGSPRGGTGPRARFPVCGQKCHRRDTAARLCCKKDESSRGEAQETRINAGHQQRRGEAVRRRSAWRRHLHQNPELGFQEVRDSRAFVAERATRVRGR